MPVMEQQPVVTGGGGASVPDDPGGFGNPEDDKENLPPWRRRRSGRLKGGSCGRQRRRRRSLLPSWYPRTPLRDVTAIVEAIEKRRARMRELEDMPRDQSENVDSLVPLIAPPSPTPEDVIATTETSDGLKPTDVLLTPSTSQSSLAAINSVPEASSSTVSVCLETPEIAALKENSTSLMVTGSRILLDPVALDMVPDKVTNTMYTPDSVLVVENSVGSVTTSDDTPVKEAAVEKWWPKHRAANRTSARGGTGPGFEGKKKNSVLQQRSRVSLMR